MCELPKNILDYNDSVLSIVHLAKDKTALRDSFNLYEKLIGLQIFLFTRAF
jgi:hypothetical protein